MQNFGPNVILVPSRTALEISEGELKSIVRWLSKKMGTKRTKAPIFLIELLWYLAFILSGVPPLNVIKSGITH